MIASQTIQDVIAEYSESLIQSEAEVRSKLITPLLEVLGYPSSLRAEEFPVYGFEGRKRLPAKNVDYVLFTDHEFAHYRGFKRAHLDWVYEHSLLVIEAKKPGEMPEILGQPKYYTTWTRAVAYMVTDGETIAGYYYNNINSDYEVINCLVEELPKHEEIWNFSYESILRIKEFSRNAFDRLKEFAYSPESLTEQNTPRPLTEEDLKVFPETTFQFMRSVLGNNAEGLSRVHLMTRFLNSADTFLKARNPLLIQPMPKETHAAHIHINKDVFPIIKGTVNEYFWGGVDRFEFVSDYITIVFCLHDNKLCEIGIGYHVFDVSASARLQNLKMARQILSADTIKVYLEDLSHRVFSLPIGMLDSLKSDIEYAISQCDECIDDIQKLRTIEEFYEINFKLAYIDDAKEIEELRTAIDLVYNGIAMVENCELTTRGGKLVEDVVIEEPTIIGKDKSILLPEKCIFGVSFVPSESWLLPGTIHFQGTTEKDIICAPGCCVYKKA